MMYTLSSPSTRWLRPEHKGSILVGTPELRALIGDAPVRVAADRDPNFPDPVASIGPHRGAKKFYALDEIIEWIESHVVGEATGIGPVAVHRALNRGVLDQLRQARSTMTGDREILAKVDAHLAEARRLLNLIERD